LLACLLACLLAQFIFHLQLLHDGQFRKVIRMAILSVLRNFTSAAEPA
jgi:hypothetical protein